jgi:hypothetical protein
MLTISSVITYKNLTPKVITSPPVSASNKDKREYRRVNGLCAQCGGSRPCVRCNEMALNRKRRSRAKQLVAVPVGSHTRAQKR